MIPSSLRGQALNAAQRAFSNRFAEADFAFVAGSIMRGTGTVGSDIDLVVVFPSLERAWRESFEEDRFPVEAFVHDLETLSYFMDLDVKNGCPVMVSMVASGEVIGPEAVAGKRLQAAAQATLAKGPPPLSGPSYDALRYQISDLADDLRGERSPEEVFAIATALYQKLGDLILLGRGAWTGR
ncbi:nucleotidyltransferase domain-containing protein, partial [Microvirga rosea]|uniref:nucleotidyltransferase domain-containing protein n=1 Tax=Microvirga rosea TaxID=2715425 RepID=UPI001D0BD062